jgi:Beta-lactamase enzyme family
MRTGGERSRRSPAHAGPLRPWERLTIALAFLLVAAGIVALSVSGAHGRSAGPQASRKTAPAAIRTPSGGGWGSVVLTRPASIRFSSAAAENARLATALAPVLRRGTGDLAAGVIDAATGAVAVFDGDRHFHAASIAKTDILATLLLQHQWADTPLTSQQRALAAEMIEDSSDQAANDLWDAAGRAEGVSVANRELGLRQTTPGDGIYWGLTSTTVEDQLRLLADLASSGSPLSAGSRSYELGLMRHVTADQAWGVTAAAVPGSAAAVKNGWLPDGSSAAWVINSIGVISHDGHEMLVAVLSSGQPSESAGIAQVDAAAKAAVSAITGGRG